MTTVTWITKNDRKVREFVGLAKILEKMDLGDLNIQIFTLQPGSDAGVPIPSGSTMHTSRDTACAIEGLVTWANCPDEGLLYFPDADGSSNQ